jgi:molecular chaperone DnaJ
MTTRESYRILGVTPKAGWEEVRRRFRILVQKYHPDRNPDNPKAVARFRRVMEAYETVRAHLARTPQSDKPYYRSRRSDKHGFFEEILGIRPQEEPLDRAMGPDFRYDLRIPFVDAILGMNTTIMVPRLASCNNCHGSGRIPMMHLQTCPDCRGQGRPIRGPGLFRGGPACRRCRGRGLIQDQFCLACDGMGHYQQYKHYSLNIPPGTEEGARLRFVGEGGASHQDGPPGNLEVVISVEPHEFFTRKGRDLHCQFKVSFVQAALGGEVKVPTLHGYARLNLPPGTQNGWTFRFPAVGAPGNSQQPPGDQIVEVVVTTPERLNLAQRNIMAELARLEKNEINRAAHE